MRTPSRFSPEMHAGAMRMVLDHQLNYESKTAAMQSNSRKFGCTAEASRIRERPEEPATV